MQRRPPGRHHTLADFLQLEVSGVHVSPLRVIAFVILTKSLPPRDDLAWYVISVPQEWAIPAFRVRNLLVAFKVRNKEVARVDICRPAMSNKEEKANKPSDLSEVTVSPTQIYERCGLGWRAWRIHTPRPS